MSDNLDHAVTVERTTPTVPDPSLNENWDSAHSVDDVATLDFGFLPIPSRLRYDPTRPVRVGLLLNITFAVSSTFGASCHLLIQLH